MPRYVQKVNPDGTSRFEEIGNSSPRPEGAFVHGDVQPFVSPIDGSVISDRKQMREHCKKHGVVPAAEFSNEHYEKAAKERERLHKGEYTRQEKFERKQEIYNTIMRFEYANR